MAKTEKKLHFRAVCLIFLFSAVVSVKVFRNQISKLVLPRERELDMALYASNQKIKTLDKGNVCRDVHANESQREIIELQKIIQMSIINDTHFEIIFHGSRIVQGRDYHMHIEYYKNNMLAPDIQPWPFIVRFAEENFTTENELQPTMASVNYSSTGNTTEGAETTEKEMQLPFSPSKAQTACQNNGECSHICVVRPGGRTCFCPAGMKITEDGKTCLVHTNPGESPSQLNKLILGVAISGSILVVIILCICLRSWHHKKKKRSRTDEDVSGTEGGGSVELQDY